MEDFNSQFKKIREMPSLSAYEKDFHRGELLKYMEGKTSPYAPRLSFYFLTFKKHVVLTILALFLILGTGTTIGANNSLPNELLYGIKTKIVEPILVLLSPTLKGRANTKVALVDKRLREFSQVTLYSKFESKQRSSFLNLLTLQIKEAHEEILQLSEEEGASEALEANNDLKSILSAQDKILEKIHATRPLTDEDKDVESVISESIQATAIVEEEIEKNLQTLDETTMEQAIEKQREEILMSLENLEEEKDILLEDAEDLDLVDADYIDSKIEELSEALQDADEKKPELQKEEALELYNMIDQDLGELQSLIDAEQELNDR